MLDDAILSMSASHPAFVHSLSALCPLYIRSMSALRPQAGAVMVFPHGDSAHSHVHEGSAVAAGVKYVIRTDVLFMLPA